MLSPFFDIGTNGDLSTSNCDYRKPRLEIQFFDGNNLPHREKGTQCISPVGEMMLEKVYGNRILPISIFHKRILLKRSYPEGIIIIYYLIWV